MLPDISILIPARNEADRTAATIRAVARARGTSARLEFVIIDDESNDDSVDRLIAAVPALLDEPNIDIRLSRLSNRAGVYGARNAAAELATADILFITDAHVVPSHGWDREVLENVRPGRVLAGVVAEPGGMFRGYGCSLALPLMGTLWNTTPIDGLATIQVAPSTATAITRELYGQLGGYDEGMHIYGAGVPEFSIRAWLRGAEVAVTSTIEVTHAFRPRDEMLDFIAGVRPFWVHNCLRFAALYLSEAGLKRVVRYFSESFPNVTPLALQVLERSDVLQRRAELEASSVRSFAWFVQHFGVTTDTGELLV
jgi:glycosyltransferase involved in cell wall biosynthesis